MSNLFAMTVACMANHLLTKLRGGDDLRLTREEFRCARITFSSSGEDLAVIRWLNTFDVPHRYIDAGCFHPIYASNTILLSKNGWTGINIDMNADRIEQFKRLRPEDANVVAALSDRVRDMTKFEYGGGLTDRLGRLEDVGLVSVLGEAPISAKKVATTTIEEVADNCGFPEGPFGYLNIDCEGHDLKVLSGLNINRRPPAVITIEASSKPEKQALVEYLSGYGYSMEEILHRTLLFVQRR